MIPATVPYVASYRGVSVTAADGKEHFIWTYKPVIAWNDEGEALVAGERGLKLASSWGNFVNLQEAPGSATVAAVSGGGWLVEYTDENDGVKWTEPIVAWLVDAEGTVTPTTTDPDGYTADLKGLGGTWKIYHPDATEPPPVKETPTVA